MHPIKTTRLLAFIIQFMAILMIIPAVIGYASAEIKAANGFVITSFSMTAICIAVLYLTRGQNIKGLNQRDAFFFTTLTWIAATAFGAVPLVISGDFHCYSDAFFEIMSGLTTTGATRLTDIESCHTCILFWRSLTNWLGGMGIVVLFLSVLPAIGAEGGAFHLMGAETVGPVKSKLTPKTRQTAKVLWLIYIGITLLQIVLLLPELTPFQAITVSFSTVSTAGFCVKNQSIASFNSPYVEWVVTVFMVLASINFSLYFKLITRRFYEIKKDVELKTYLSIILISTIAGSLGLRTIGFYSDFGTSFRKMFFNVASIISTTGFTCANYLEWPDFVLMILIMLMFVGGCAGSTGGGIKVIRLITAKKSFEYSTNKRIHPDGVFRISIGEDIIPRDSAISILSFIAVYFCTWLIGSFIVSFSGIGITQSLSASILTLGNIGAGFGGENFATMPQWTNWVFSALMLVGRLELYTAYALFSKTFRR